MYMYVYDRFSLLLCILERVNGYLKITYEQIIRKNLSKNLQTRYLNKGRFYHILEFFGGKASSEDDETAPPCLSDPSQRIVRDVDALCESGSEILYLCKPLVELVAFVWRIYELVGSGATKAFGLYLITGGALMSCIMPNFKAIISQERALQSEYASRIIP